MATQMPSSSWRTRGNKEGFALVTSFPSCCALPSAHPVEQGTVRAVLMIGKLDKSFPVSPMLLPGGGTLCETSETGDMV